MLKPLPCIAYRRKNVGQFSAPYVWRRSWARRRQHFLIQRKKKAVVRYAREHNLGKIILGRPASRRWWRRETFADRLARIAPDLDQVLVALDEPPARTINNAPDSRSFKDKWRVQIQGCVVAAALCAVITLIAMQC